ncbi:MAG: hypothetical protein AAB631_01060 [Patescibacteria group bacterium]
MERSELIKKVAGLIQVVFNAESKDGKLERIYGMDSLFRDTAKLQFARSVKSHDILVESGSDAKGFRAQGQWLIDIAPQLIAVRLVRTLFKGQDQCRERIREYALNARVKRGFISRDTLRHWLGEQQMYAEAIELWKSRFKELILCAKELGFEVFEGGEHQHHLYVALEISL